MGFFDFFWSKKKDVQPLTLNQETDGDSTATKEAKETDDADVSSKYKSKEVATLPANIQEILAAASLGILGAQSNNWKIEQDNLFKLFNLVQDSCSQMLQIPLNQYNIIGSAFSLLLSHKQIQSNEEVACAVADYAFYGISKAIEANPGQEALHTKRLSILAETRDYFFYTIANAMELPDYDPFDFFASMPLIVRTNSYLFAMVKYDLQFISNTRFDGKIGNLISAALNAMSNETASDGKEYIDQTVTYLTKIFAQY